MQEEIAELREEMEAKKLKKFNWGAFLGTWIWGIGHRVNHWSMYLAFVLFVLQLLKVPSTAIIGFVLSVYVGIVANDLAYNKSSKKYKDMDEYFDIEKVWTIWMFVLSIIAFLGSFIYGLLKNTTTLS